MQRSSIEQSGYSESSRTLQRHGSDAVFILRRRDR